MSRMHANQVATCISCLLLTGLSLACQAQPRPEPDTRVVEVEEGVFIDVMDWGGRGSPLLFLPSWASTFHIYDDFAPRFANEHHVLVMNMRGHGTVTRPDHGYTIPRLIRDIEAVLEALEIDRVHLAGLSRSESLITHFAAQFPNRLRSLVYLSGPIDRAYSREFYRQQQNLTASYRNYALEQAIVSLCSINKDFERPADSFDGAANNLGIEWRDNDPRPPYEDVRVPALALWSPIRAKADQFRASCERSAESDVAEVLVEMFEEISEPLFELMDHDMQLFRGELRRGELFEVPGATYHTFLSHPTIVEAEMRRFLQGIDSTSGDLR